MPDPKRDLSEHDSDYDGAWKEALKLYFEPFLAKYFPKMHAAIDWTRPQEWLDKEVSQILGQSGSRNKRVDLLVRVWLSSGQSQWILLHTEVQSSPEVDFASRIARYNAGLFWSFKQRVVSLVILADLNRGWLPFEDTFEVPGFATRLRFEPCKLIDKLDTDWQDDSSLPVQVARAQIEALRTANDPEDRYRAKWQLVRNLYGVGYNAEEVRELFRLIDWMMHLRLDLEQRFRQELHEFEEGIKMPYVTSVERLAMAEGEAKGKAEGKAEGKTEGGAAVLIRPLSKVCGPLPEDVKQQIHLLTFGRLERLGEDLLEIQSLDDLRRWLDGHST
jgi:hypothetical protein